MTTPILTIKKVYSFDVYPSIILGTNFKNVTVLSTMDYESALAFMDVTALHVNVYPYLPSGYPDDPSSTDYVRIRMPSGQATIIGLNWINPTTVVEIESMRAIIEVENVSNATVPLLASALTQNGFNNYTIKINGVPV